MISDSIIKPNQMETIINKNKNLVAKVIELIIKEGMQMYIIPLFTFFPNLFDGVKWKKLINDTYEHEYEWYVKDGNVRVKEYLDGEKFYMFNYFSKDKRDDIIKNNSELYTNIKYHLDRNPIMKYLPKPKLEESIIYKQVNYLLS